jgi:CDP-diacylglycerol pyrophosphatase
MHRSRGRAISVLVGALVASVALQACGTPSSGNSNALWIVVDTGCNQGWAPIPSLQCFRERGDAVLKDLCGETHYLLIPTARRAGVESPEVLRDDEPDYFGDAWAARDHVISASGRREVASDELGLAINSRWGRTQGQLHIHIDFVRPETRSAIRQWQRDGASRATIELFGHRYRIVHADSLRHPSPFQQAASTADPQLQREMNTIAVVGDGTSGFYLLFGRADATRLDRGHAEEILVPRHCNR